MHRGPGPARLPSPFLGLPWLRCGYQPAHLSRPTRPPAVPAHVSLRAWSPLKGEITSPGALGHRQLALQGAWGFFPELR
jgi:hypothetical protein